MVTGMMVVYSMLVDINQEENVCVKLGVDEVVGGNPTLVHIKKDVIYEDIRDHVNIKILIN
jgi:hypothetical protein